jgi:tripeptide aminopeptidase
MFANYPFTAAERFMRYVQIDTQSDPLSETSPTSEKQKDLSKLLAKELKAMGIADAHMDQSGYVYATIPSNTSKKVPVICILLYRADFPGKYTRRPVASKNQPHYKPERL